LSVPTADLPHSFFRRPAEEVAPELVGCLLVKRHASGELLWGVIVETEAYCQSEPACHGHRRRTPSNETLFGEPGRFYVYVSYGIHHCVNVVTGQANWANGVLLRALAMPGEPERIAAGPALLARRFGLDRRHDGVEAAPASGLWLAPRLPELALLIGSGGQAKTEAWPVMKPAPWSAAGASGCPRGRSCLGVGICEPAAASVAGHRGIVAPAGTRPGDPRSAWTEHWARVWTCSTPYGLGAAVGVSGQGPRGPLTCGRTTATEF